MSKIFSICFGFALNTSQCDWLAKLAPLYEPMGSQTKPIVTCSHAFSRVWHQFSLNSDWFIALFESAVIGQSNLFGLGVTCTVLNREAF